MNAPEHFQVAESHACYRPVGRVSLQEGVKLCSDAIAFSREQQIRKLLIDTTQLTGFVPPNTMERFTMSEQWAAVAKSSVKVAIVAKPEMLDPDRFGITVARNRGLFANVFTSETEALTWLLDPNAK